MHEATICQEIEIDAPAARVWQYVGTAEGLQQWWGTEIRLEARQGGQCEESGVVHGSPYYLTGEVTVYDPPSRLLLTLRDGNAHYRQPVYTTISLTLSERAGRTRVAVVHRRHAQPGTVANVDVAAGAPAHPAARLASGKIATEPVAGTPMPQPALGAPELNLSTYPIGAAVEIPLPAASLWAARLNRLKAQFQ
jgi:uncharacterized protein YndB with AHSA1/START domain